jgi:hypothetical protein
LTYEVTMQRGFGLNGIRTEVPRQEKVMGLREEFALIFETYTMNCIERGSCLLGAWDAKIDIINN